MAQNVTEGLQIPSGFAAPPRIAPNGYKEQNPQMLETVALF
jgi:hypothetical protein